MTLPVRSLRLDARPASYLDKLSGTRGEVFFDNDSETLRIFNGERGGVPLLRADFSNIADGNNIDFGGKAIVADLTGNVTGQVSDISNHSINALNNVNIDTASSGQVLYYTGSDWQATTLSSTFNGGNVGGITTFLNTTQSTTNTNGSLITSGGLGVAKNINAGGNITVTGSISTLSTFSTSGNLSVNTSMFTVDSVTGNMVVAGSTTIGGNTTITGEVVIKTENALKFYDSDNSNFVSFKAASNINADVVFVLPSIDGDPGQVLSTDGFGTLGWTTPSTGGGGGGGSDPAGSTGQVQYNNAGIFAADIDFYFTSAENKLSVPNIAATSITGDLIGDVVGDVVGDVYATNGTYKVIESGTDGTDAVVNADLVGDVTGNVTGSVTGPVTTSSASVTGGTVDNTAIGASTRSTGAFTTLTANASTSFTSTTDSASPTTGAVKVGGGLGVSLNTHVGGNITAEGDINAVGNITAGNSIIIENSPINTTDATNKQYVDTRAIAMAVALS